MIEKILETESGNVHYWISDQIDYGKKTIFFLHGLTASHELFVKQIEYFDGKFNVIAWDAPAHGASRPYKDFTYEKAAFAARDILRANKIDGAVFVGQSMGGFISQSVIKRFPELVKGFVSIDSTPFGEKYYSKSDKWWLKQIEWMSSCYPDKSLRKAVAKQITRTERSYQNMLQMHSYYDKKELCHLLGIGFAGFLEDNSDIKINCPVMLIVGEEESTGKVKQYNAQWAEDLGVPITWIKGAAHNSNDDQPELVNEQIEKFMDQIFPDVLDNAKVLFYTPKGDYGDLFYDDGTVASHFAYLAICKYEKDNSFCLFKCNENFEVETDELWSTIEECMRMTPAGNNSGDIKWLSKTDDAYSNYLLAVEVTFFSGGREKLPSAGYRPDAVFEGYNESDPWGIYFAELDADSFDKPSPAKIRFSMQTYHYHQVKAGQRFTFMEGPVKVGEGRIVEFLID
ncbi:MAG: alpha/beta fold hydrolase [Saccharofermentans sp.]|nr:alpha/beta fold hydrolase [Saccharofermentans sp.]